MSFKQTNDAFVSLSLWRGPSLAKDLARALSERGAATQHKLCSSPRYKSHCGFQFSRHPPLPSQAPFRRPYSLEVISRPFAALLLSFSIENLDGTRTSDWQAGADTALRRQLAECWALLLRPAPCCSSLVISLTVDLAEIAGLLPRASLVQVTADCMWSAGSWISLDLTGHYFFFFFFAATAVTSGTWDLDALYICVNMHQTEKQWCTLIGTGELSWYPAVQML